MYKTILSWGAKILAPLVLAAGLVFLGFNYGQQTKQAELQPQLDSNKTSIAELTAANNNLRGQITGMVTASTEVSKLRDELKEARKQERSVIDNMIANLMRRLPKTGDECVDARAVAVQYFNELRSQQPKGDAK